MKNKTMKKFWQTLLCVICVIPAILIATGSYRIQKPGGMSTMGVIIGPIILPDDDVIMVERQQIQQMNGVQRQV